MTSIRTIHPAELSSWRLYLDTCPDHWLKARLLNLILGMLLNEAGDQFISPEAQEAWQEHLADMFLRMGRWCEQCIPGWGASKGGA